MAKGARAGLLTAIVPALLLAAAVPAGGAGDCGDGMLDSGEDCDDGNRFGGDGCAENCTSETVRLFLIDSARSVAWTQFKTFRMSLNLSGSLKFTMGQPGSDGVITFVVRSSDVGINRVPVPGLACTCVRSEEVPDFFGPGNVGVGRIGCGEEGLFGRDYTLTQDHNGGMVNTCEGGASDGNACTGDDGCPDGACFTAEDCLQNGGMVEPPEAPHAGLCNAGRQFAISEQAPRGTMQILDNVAFSLIFGNGDCSTDPTFEANGPDGIPCTDDDPNQAPGRNVPAITGTATAAIFSANNDPALTIQSGEMCGAEECRASETGQPFDCDAILGNRTGGLETGLLAFAFQILDYPLVGDALATLTLGAKPAPTCAGDCDGDDSVTVSELVKGVNIAMGAAAVDTCQAVDVDLSGSVEINELVAAVNSALSGCG